MATVRYKTFFYSFFSGVVCVNKYSAKVRPHEKNFPSFLKVISVPCYGLTMCQFPLQPRPPRENLWLQFSLLFFSYTYFLGVLLMPFPLRGRIFFCRIIWFLFYPTLYFVLSWMPRTIKKWRARWEIEVKCWNLKKFIL